MTVAVLWKICKSVNKKLVLNADRFISYSWLMKYGYVTNYGGVSPMVRLIICIMG